MDQKLIEYLKSRDISYKIHEHPAVFTVSESKNIKINIPGVHTKNLFLKGDSGKFYLVCMPGEKRLNIKFLEKHLKEKKIRFGSSEELKEKLNLTPGSVSIFGMIYSKEVNLIIDQEIWDAKITGFHPNLNTSTLEISHEALESFYNSLNSNKEVLKIE